MKVYISASYARKEELKPFAELLKFLGHEIVSRWIYEDLTEEDAGVIDAQDVEAAEIFIGFLENSHTCGYQSGGRHVELGIALHMGIPIFIFGEPENVFHKHTTVHCVPFSWPT